MLCWLTHTLDIIYYLPCSVLSTYIKCDILFFLPLDSSGLRNVYLEAPEAAERGAKVEMRCHYELENEVLYTVKWYRGEREFCRYSPRDVPPLKIFKIPGISVVVMIALLISSRNLRNKSRYIPSYIHQNTQHSLIERVLKKLSLRFDNESYLFVLV